MASIHREIWIEASAETVWAAVRAFGAPHLHLVPGFVIEARLDGDARMVTFADGSTARELLVDVDEGRRRLVYASVGGRAKHHNASMQVFSEGAHRSRLVWITDLLPNELAPLVLSRVERGAELIKQTLERTNISPG